MRIYRFASAQNVVVAAVTLALLLVVLPAAASNLLGHTAGGGQDILFRQCNLTANVHDAFHWNDNGNVNNETILNTTLRHSCSEDEVEVMDGNYNASWIGKWECQNWGFSGTCLEANVFIDVADGPFTTRQWRHLLCHEVGHAIALAHSGESSSCMAGPGTIDYTEHDEDMIDNTYSRLPNN